MGVGISVGLLGSAIVTGFGIILASGFALRPVDGQLPSDWGWSLIMMGLASLCAFAYFAWLRFHRGA